MPHPNPPEPTPAARQAGTGQATTGQGRSRPRRPRPGPPGFTIEVQVLGGEAGRRLDQEQTEAVAAVLAWLAAHPPTPFRGRVGGRRRRHARRAEHSDADWEAAGPAEPGGGNGHQHAAGDGRERGSSQWDKQR